MEQNRGGMPGGAPNGYSSTSISYSGATTISEDVTLGNTSYSSTNGAENALLVSGGIVTLENIDVNKTGDDSGDNADFYGTNAAILAYNGADLAISGATILTNGAHANAVFAYGSGEISISESSIVTSSNNSGGVMVTGGGTLVANNVSVHTAGNSSAAIRSDRGGGTMTISGGSYITDGVGSPAIYSTADITVRNANLVSTASEGVVIEGMNSVILENTTLTDTNNTLNGNSETYKNVFIYQSMSGDATEGTGTFTAENSTILTNNGDSFFVTNTTALINLTNNVITNVDESGAFLRVQSGKWGNSGSNGGNVTLNATSQEIIGDIAVDSISSVWLNMSYSYFKGTFSGEGAKEVTLSDDSVMVLTGDTYLTELTNEDMENNNIYANGYHLYLNGTEVAINQAEAPESFLSATEEAEAIEIKTLKCDNIKGGCGDDGFPTWGYVAIGAGILIIGAIISVLVFRKKGGKKDPKVPEMSGTPEVVVSNSEIPMESDNTPTNEAR